MFSEQIEAIFLFVVLVWSSASSTLTFGQTANSIRDEILTGHTDGQRMTPTHRRAKFKNDWVPTKMAGGLLCLFYAVALVLVPIIAEVGSLVRSVVWFAAAVPVIGFCFFLLGVRDYHLIKTVLDDE